MATSVVARGYLVHVFIYIYTKFYTIRLLVAHPYLDVMLVPTSATANS